MDFSPDARQRLRDLTRVRWPRARDLYERRIAPRLGRGDRDELRFRSWVSEGQDLLREQGTHALHYEADGVWVDDGTGILWSYEPNLPSSAMWTESGEPHEVAEVDALVARIPEGGVFADVGANVGSYSIPLARRRPDLSILAFEPSALTVAILHRNAEKNRVAERIEIRPEALWSEGGSVPLTTRLGGENFVAKGRVSGPAVERVPATTLDDVFGHGGCVDAIKCDVEGAELAVLRGGEKVIETSRPLLLLEIERRHVARFGNAPEDVFRHLSERGYRYERFIDGALEDPSGNLATDLEESRNFLFSPIASGRM